MSVRFEFEESSFRSSAVMARSIIHNSQNPFRRTFRHLLRIPDPAAGPPRNDANAKLEDVLSL
jgi:hypothetical protein